MFSSSQTTTNSRPSTSSSIHVFSPDLSKDLFTPTTFSELDSLIELNSLNLITLSQTVRDPELVDAIKANLLDERNYLFTQKGKHLAATLQMAKNTPLNDVYK